MKFAVMALSLVSMGALIGCTESFDLSISYQTSTVPRAALTIDDVAGGVRLVRGPVGTPIAGTVKIHAAGFDEKAQAKEAAAEVEIREIVEGDELILAVVLPERHRNKTFAVTFDLSVPENLVVSAFTDDGRISVDGLVVAELDTTFGDVDLAFTASPVGATTLVRTSDARVTVDSHEGPIDVATTNGQIDLFSIAGSTRASTTQGPINARVLPPRGGEVFLATSNAPIDLGIPREFGARLLAVTTAPGGVLVSDLQFTPTGSFPNQAEGILGDGAGRVDLRTIGADIFVHR